MLLDVPAIASGTAFPTNQSAGSLFLQTDGERSRLYIYDGANWSLASLVIQAGSYASATQLALIAIDEHGLLTHVASLNIHREFNIDGDITGTISNGTGSLQLKSSGATPGTFGSADLIPRIVVNDKGQITSIIEIPIAQAPAVQESQIQGRGIIARVADNENVTGNWSFTKPIAGVAPTEGHHLATSDYVHEMISQHASQMISGTSFHVACETATNMELPTCTYSNGADGRGAMLTGLNVTLGPIGNYDRLSVTSRILVKNQPNPRHNGVYTVTALGNSNTPWVLTRAGDFDGSTEPVMAGNIVFITHGTYASMHWVITSKGTGAQRAIILGTDPVVFSQFSGVVPSAIQNLVGSLTDAIHDLNTQVQELKTELTVLKSKK